MKQPYPIMRLFAVFLIVIITCCIHSCKKDNQQSEIIATDNTVAEIKEWLSVQKDDSVAVQNIIVSAQWDKARSIGADSSVYQLVPLSSINAVKFEADKKIQRYLVLQRQQGAVTGGYIYEMFGSPDDLLKNENELIAGFASKKLNFAFTGNLAKFSLKGAFNESSVYQNGILKQYRKLYKGTTNGANRIQTTGSKKLAALQCSDWYLITYYTDGTVTSEYLGRTCYCNDQQQSTAIRDGKGAMAIKISCADGGGGGSDPGGDGPCPPQTSQSIKNNKVVLTVKLSSCDIVVYEPDPCAQAKALANDTAYKNKMTSLKSKTGLSKEVGYMIDASGNFVYVEGVVGQQGITSNVTTPLSGYIHTHYTGLYPTFSGQDIKAIYDLNKAGKINDISTFTAGVVTAEGTTYLMKVVDATKFATFGQTNLETQAVFDAFETEYDLHSAGFSVLNSLNNAREMALLKTLENSGIEVFKGNDAFSAWDKINLNQLNSNSYMNTTVTTTNCN